MRLRPASLTRMVQGGALLFLLGVSQGCYVYSPVVNAPTPGQQLRFDLNDRGRVGLGEFVGSSAERLEGVLTGELDSAYAVKVVSVSYLTGQSSKWSGEQLVVSKNFVGNVRLREFSAARTYLTAAAVLGAAVLLIATRGLFGSGTVDREPPNPGPPGGPSFR